jgi:hypothetical protein
MVKPERKRFAVDAQVRVTNPGINATVTQVDDEPTVLGEYWHTVKTEQGERREPGCNIELVPKPELDHSGMKVAELSSRVEKFRKELNEHAELWGRSLDRTMPDYPIRNHDQIRAQYDGLARQLGTLRPYFKKLGVPTIMGNSYLGHWDAFDSAVSDGVAPRKGQSIQAVLSQLNQALGKLDLLNPDSEFSLDSEPVGPAAPHHVTNIIYNLQGAQSRVNIQSNDLSTNVSSVTEPELFSKIRSELSQGIRDEEALREVLTKLDELEAAKGSKNFLSKYQDFINAAAAHMTILAPFLPALTQMLK